MSVVKIGEPGGESEENRNDAMKNLVEEAQATLRGITRIGVSEFEVRLKDGLIDTSRVRAKASFRSER